MCYRKFLGQSNFEMRVMLLIKFSRNGKILKCKRCRYFPNCSFFSNLFCELYMRNNEGGTAVSMILVKC